MKGRQFLQDTELARRCFLPDVRLLVFALASSSCASCGGGCFCTLTIMQNTKQFTPCSVGSLWHRLVFSAPRFVPGTDIPVPTHYFAVLTSCRNSTKSVSACDGELQAVSFLLPHRPDNSESCQVRNLVKSRFRSPQIQWNLQ